MTLPDHARQILEEARREDWYTVKEFAFSEGVSLRTVDRWIQQQILEVKRNGKHGHRRVKRKAA